MSEDVTKSPEEIKADIARTKAETKKIEAETRKADADALVAELAAQAEYRKRQREKTSDEENYLYRFAGEVSKNSITNCVKKLTQWSRLKPKCDIEIVFSS